MFSVAVVVQGYHVYTKKGRPLLFVNYCVVKEKLL